MIRPSICFQIVGSMERVQLADLWSNVCRGFDSSTLSRFLLLQVIFWVIACRTRPSWALQANLRDLQRRSREHCIRDTRDFENHFDYIHYKLQSDKAWTLDASFRLEIFDDPQVHQDGTLLQIGRKFAPNT